MIFYSNAGINIGCATFSIAFCMWIVILNPLETVVITRQYPFSHFLLSVSDYSLGGLKVGKWWRETIPDGEISESPGMKDLQCGYGVLQSCTRNIFRYSPLGKISWHVKHSWGKEKFSSKQVLCCLLCLFFLSQTVDVLGLSKIFIFLGLNTTNIIYYLQKV